MAATATAFAAASIALATAFEVIVGGLAHVDNLAREMKVFACHLMVEVHLYMVIVDG